MATEIVEIKFICKEQDWANETTRYWFNVDGDEYCIADKNGDLTLLDKAVKEYYEIKCAEFLLRDYGVLHIVKTNWLYNALIIEREKHLND